MHLFVSFHVQVKRKRFVIQKRLPVTPKGFLGAFRVGVFFFFLMTVYYLMKNERISHLQGSL